MGSEGLSVRLLSREELDVLIGWAAREGWDPGRDDAEVFWHTDPEAYVGFDVDGELGGAASGHVKLMFFGVRFRGSVSAGAPRGTKSVARETQ